MSFAIVSLILLVVIAVIVALVLARVVGTAARRNPNRPGGEGTDEREENDRHSGPNRR